MLEKKIERTVCRYARKKGFLVLKLNIVGQRGWPDDLFIDPDGWHVYIEFKQKGKPCDPIQLHRHRELEQRNAMVFIVDDEEEGKKVVDDMVAARLSKEGSEAIAESGERGVVLRPRFRKD